jgi:hypothetical protein
MRDGNALKQAKALLKDLKDSVYEKPTEVNNTLKRVTDLISKQSKSTWKATQNIQDSIMNPVKRVYNKAVGW